MIEIGRSTRDEVLGLVNQQNELWLRIAAYRQGSEWLVARMEITTTTAPPSWSSRRWNYDEAVFVAVETTGIDVAAWLRSEEATIDDLKIKLSPIPDGDSVNWHYHGSRVAYGGYEPLSWPYTSYELQQLSTQQRPDSGSLVSHDSPSFVRFAEAAASFFGVPAGPGASNDHLQPTFRLQDMSGRLTAIRIRPTEVAVTVEGENLYGMVVELASESPGPMECLSSEGTQTVRFPLPNGLPSGAWVVLKRESRWIDRKFINYPHTLSSDPGVEMIVEPLTELEALISGGEGATVEFKSVIPGTGTKLREKVCQIVAAFANGDGGQVLFGVDDDGTLVGLPEGTDAKGACDTVAQFVTSTVTPLPRFSPGLIEFGGERSGVVLVLTVESGSDPPYGVNPAHPKYYVRRGATTPEALADQVRTLARSRPPADQAYGSPFGFNQFK